MKDYKLLQNFLAVLYIKLGGSLITPKKKGSFEIRERVIREIAAELGKILPERQIFLAHGAGPFGHVPVMKYGLQNGFMPGKELGVSETLIRVMELNMKIADLMLEKGIPVLPFHPRSVFRRIDGKVIPDLFTISSWMEMGLVPLTHGDLINDEERGVYVLSADEIPLYLRPLGVDEVIFLTDVPGVMDEHGNILPYIGEEDIPDLGGATFDVTGSMRGKLDAAFKLAKTGVKVRIAGFKNGGDLIKAIAGESGTMIKLDLS